MIRKISLIAFFSIILVYALFQGRFIIFGPKIVVDFPKEDGTVNLGILLINGKVENAAYLALNDRQIYTDKEGKFEEKLIAHEGINIIKLTAKDRFGREKERIIRVNAE